MSTETGSNAEAKGIEVGDGDDLHAGMTDPKISGPVAPDGAAGAPTGQETAGTGEKPVWPAQNERGEWGSNDVESTMSDDQIALRLAGDLVRADQLDTYRANNPDKQPNPTKTAQSESDRAYYGKLQGKAKELVDAQIVELRSGGK